jgi:hypothetical protein
MTQVRQMSDDELLMLGEARRLPRLKDEGRFEYITIFYFCLIPEHHQLYVVCQSGIERGQMMTRACFGRGLF